MTTRDELVGAGSQALFRDGLDAWAAMGVGAMAGRVVDAVEPLIRADERKSVKAEYVPVLMEHLRILADLRAQVEALPGAHLSGDARGVVYRAAVLALIGGSE
jgi:hypothetical protein